MRDIFGIFRSKKKGFEENLNKMYQEIANKINEMIPVEWDKVYTKAYIKEESKEVFFYYTLPGSEELHYYTAIPKEHNVSKKYLMNCSISLISSLSYSYSGTIPNFLYS